LHPVFAVREDFVGEEVSRIMKVLSFSSHTRHGWLLNRGVSFIVILAYPSMAAWGQTPGKRTVAVLDFNNAAVQAGISNSYLRTDTPALGRGVSELLISKLVQDGIVTVVERAAIDKVLAEQNLTNSDRADPATAAALGKILGVDAIILGTITRYDYDEKMKGYVGHARGSRGSASPQAKYDVTAKVQISTRLVSPDTAEVLAALDGVGETNRKGVVMDVRDTSGHVMQAVSLNNPVVNGSLDKAVAQLAAQLEPALVKLSPRAAVVEGLVADVSESGQLVLNVGTQQGVKVGDRLQVLRNGSEVRDPATGKVLISNDTPLGEAVVTKVNDISCIAQYHGSETVKVRDLVKVIASK
jgi:curli biogenesis system outer membrane secretion channel CsgG